MAAGGVGVDVDVVVVAAPSPQVVPPQGAPPRLEVLGGSGQEGLPVLDDPSFCEELRQGGHVPETEALDDADPGLAEQGSQSGVNYALAEEESAAASAEGWGEVVAKAA